MSIMTSLVTDAKYITMLHRRRINYKPPQSQNTKSPLVNQFSISKSYDRNECTHDIPILLSLLKKHRYSVNNGSRTVQVLQSTIFPCHCQCFGQGNSFSRRNIFLPPYASLQLPFSLPNRSSPKI